jgi:hypothetical protein
MQHRNRNAPGIAVLGALEARYIGCTVDQITYFEGIYMIPRHTRQSQQQSAVPRAWQGRTPPTPAPAKGGYAYVF